jgi:hypothetical protein
MKTMRSRTRSLTCGQPRRDAAVARQGPGALAHAEAPAFQAQPLPGVGGEERGDRKARQHLAIGEMQRRETAHHAVLVGDGADDAHARLRCRRDARERKRQVRPRAGEPGDVRRRLGIDQREADQLRVVLARPRIRVRERRGGKDRARIERGGKGVVSLPGVGEENVIGDCARAAGGEEPMRPGVDIARVRPGAKPRREPLHRGFVDVHHHHAVHRQGHRKPALQRIVQPPRQTRIKSGLGEQARQQQSAGDHDQGAQPSAVRFR